MTHNNLPIGYLITFHERATPRFHDYEVHGTCYTLSGVELSNRAPKTCLDTQISGIPLTYLCRERQERVKLDQRISMATQLLQKVSAPSQQRCVLLPTSKVERLIFEHNLANEEVAKLRKALVFYASGFQEGGTTARIALGMEKKK